MPAFLATACSAVAPSDFSQPGSIAISSHIATISSSLINISASDRRLPACRSSIVTSLIGFMTVHASQSNSSSAAAKRFAASSGCKPVICPDKYTNLYISLFLLKKAFVPLPRHYSPSLLIMSILSISLYQHLFGKPNSRVHILYIASEAVVYSLQTCLRYFVE